MGQFFQTRSIAHHCPRKFLFQSSPPHEISVGKYVQDNIFRGSEYP
jgi:hypothetical protein